MYHENRNACGKDSPLRYHLFPSCVLVSEAMRVLEHEVTAHEAAALSRESEMVGLHEIPHAIVSEPVNATLSTPAGAAQRRMTNRVVEAEAQTRSEVVQFAVVRPSLLPSVEGPTIRLEPEGPSTSPQGTLLDAQLA